MRILAVAGAFLLLLSGCAVSNEYLVGEDLYARSCATCHDVDGAGGLGLDIGPGSNTHLNLTDEQIASVIAVGPGNMPGYGRLTQEQLDSLVAYIRALAD